MLGFAGIIRMAYKNYKKYQKYKKYNSTRVQEYKIEAPGEGTRIHEYKSTIMHIQEYEIEVRDNYNNTRVQEYKIEVREKVQEYKSTRLRCGRKYKNTREIFQEQQKEQGV